MGKLHWKWAGIEATPQSVIRTNRESIEQLCIMFSVREFFHCWQSMAWHLLLVLGYFFVHSFIKTVPHGTCCCCCFFFHVFSLPCMAIALCKVFRMIRWFMLLFSYWFVCTLFNQIIGWRRRRWVLLLYLFAIDDCWCQGAFSCFTAWLCILACANHSLSLFFCCI